MYILLSVSKVSTQDLNGKLTLIYHDHQCRRLSLGDFERGCRRIDLSARLHRNLLEQS